MLDSEGIDTFFHFLIFLLRSTHKQGKMPRRGRPQRALFPLKDWRVMFEKTPLSGIEPSSLLKERFKLVRNVRLASDAGMLPERELYDRSMVSMLTSPPNELGICSWNVLFDRFR